MRQQLAKIVRESRGTVFFGGAGVSTESGIPDFRSKDGLYRAKKVYGRSPEELISHSFFMRHPSIFFDYYRNNLLYQDAQPNSAHCALAELERIGKLKAVVTQNIDGLHQLAGSKVVHELHGSVLRNYCMNCGKTYGLDYIVEPPVEKEGVPLCVCGGMVRPDVVLYEEALDQRVMEAAAKAIAQAETLIVGGTSLVVYPAAGLLHYFQGKHLILINRDQTDFDGRAQLVIHDSIGEVMAEVMALLSVNGYSQST